MRYLTLLLSTLCLLWTSESHAAPFCASKKGIAPECYYVDANECRKRAREINGECTANNRELIIKRGFGRFCLVNSNKTTACDYADRASCEGQASANGGVCIEAPKPEHKKPIEEQEPEEGTEKEL
jgi:hypothetical protein